MLMESMELERGITSGAWSLHPFLSAAQRAALNRWLLLGLVLSLSLAVVACSGLSNNDSDQTLTITDIPDQEVLVSMSRSLQVMVTGNADAVMYRVSPMSTGGATLVINATGQLTIDAASASEVTVDVTVTVKRGSEMDNETFQLSIAPELTVESIADQTIRAGASDNINIQVITAGGLESDTVMYDVTGSVLVRRLVSIDSSGLLTIDASAAGGAAAAPVVVSATNSRTTVTDSFVLTITPLVLMIRVTDAFGDQVSECDLVEGDIASFHNIGITGPPVVTALRWRIEPTGGIMDGDVTDSLGFPYGEVGVVYSMFITPLGGGLDISLRTRDDGTPNPDGRTLTISILPSLTNGYQLPTTAGMGYTIGPGGNVQVVCSSVDAPPAP